MIYTKFSRKMMTQVSLKHFVHILNLRSFFKRHSNIIKSSASNLTVKVIFLKQITLFKFKIISNYSFDLALNSTRLTTKHSRKIFRAINSLKFANEKHNRDQKNKLANNVVLLHHLSRNISSLRSVLTSHLYRLMNVYNFFFDCSKMHYHVALLTLY